MKKICTLLCLILSLAIAFSAAACVKTPDNAAPGETTPGDTTPGETTPGDTPPGETTPTPPVQSGLTMTASATEEEIEISISGTDETAEGNYDVISLRAYEYLDGEENGMSEDVITAEELAERKVGDYSANANATVQIDRIAENTGYDRVYDKFYLVKEDEIKLGPVYAAAIPSKEDGEPEYMSKITSKKGALSQGLNNLLDLGCQHTAINFALDGAIYENWKYNGSGEIVEDAAPSADAYYEFEFDGKKFYFQKATVDSWDSGVKEASDNGIDVTAMLHNGINNVPYAFTYKKFNAQNVSGLLAGMNTSNELGMMYWAALMEFLAERYSGGTDSKGYVSSYILGNEVDYEHTYFALSEQPRPLSVFIEEYYRLLRAANTAVKKYSPCATVNGSFTHGWANPGHTSTDNTRTYAVKDILDGLNAKSKAQGDFDWGLTAHCYGFSLPVARIFEFDTSKGRELHLKADNSYSEYGTDDDGTTVVSMTGDYNTSDSLTYSNLEILDQYLGQEHMRYDGKLRNVYLTESGISSGNIYGNEAYHDKTTDGVELSRAIQAAAIAAGWYKVAQLECVKSYCYYRLIDALPEMISEEIGLQSFGLMDVHSRPKPSYYMWKFIDTQYSATVTSPFLRYITYYDLGGNFVSGALSYLEVMDLFGTNYDFSGFKETLNGYVTTDKTPDYEKLFGGLPQVKLEPVKISDVQHPEPQQ